MPDEEKMNSIPQDADCQCHTSATATDMQTLFPHPLQYAAADILAIVTAAGRPALCTDILRGIQWSFRSAYGLPNAKESP